ncbi:2-amino-4-hydroxy-6- hydroxymethyldihydropteridine pyrophosphokinase [Roseibacterium elongatum DSM 19469]|uniref:2-amino-4-hydroxy-6-hydroxymethyldihydropteridine pyrophosphokinase n=1 Tax=Roseicyclus elongatus DSM 19469 TaxID=1294273 RepID=W8RRY6_9RHOB|nr:2-amino-4-hydroxy-6-hydroxymethyldihydropteridine diphosphokinase [Roseibacterium elongatum]AHM03878.1 2-amino-4-hydroxy-6- hydroxymethyldihydropteridine pyrophosphokinase [Roseibacterium elongatum DSM 19469]
MQAANAPGTVYVALGANLPGPFASPKAGVLHALERLCALPGGRRLHGGGLYRTPAYPAGNGPDFVNAVVAIEADNPAAFIQAAFGIEAEFNRAEDRKAGRWAPRAIDIDIVALGDRIWPDPARHKALRDMAPIDRVLTDDEIVIPHPAMQERAFVLKPMVFFAPDWRHPALGKTARDLALALPRPELEAVVPLT